MSFCSPIKNVAPGINTKMIPIPSPASICSAPSRPGIRVGSAFERAQRRLAAREAALDQVDEQIAHADARAVAVTQLVESAEVNIAALAHKSARRATGARKPRRAKAKATVEAKPVVRRRRAAESNAKS